MTLPVPPLEGDFLTRIADQRMRRVEEMRALTPAHVLRERLGPLRPGGRLERALRRGTAPALFESANGRSGASC